MIRRLLGEIWGQQEDAFTSTIAKAIRGNLSMIKEGKEITLWLVIECGVVNVMSVRDS